ncbi:hypothetical protein HDU90_007723 [Geranomyces variabilis]|nr:hypothetical protein HDU90_007723 [Geranomyces variabilis]
MVNALVCFVFGLVAVGTIVMIGRNFRQPHKRVDPATADLELGGVPASRAGPDDTRETPEDAIALPPYTKETDNDTDNNSGATENNNGTALNDDEPPPAAYDHAPDTAATPYTNETDNGTDNNSGSALNGDEPPPAAYDHASDTAATP